MMPLDRSCSIGNRCKQRRCLDCHGARRSLRSWFVKMQRQDEWESMNPESKRQLVKEHKNKGRGKGRKRDINVEEKASCKDGVKLGNQAPFLTKKQLLKSNRYYF